MARRERFTVAESWGNNFGETNSRSLATARCSARKNKTARTGTASNAQNHPGDPKFIRSTSSSWQFFPNRLRQEELGNEQPSAAHDAEREQIAVLLIFLHRHGRFLQLVDVAVDLFERFRVGRAEKLPVGDLRDLSQARFVEFNPLILIEKITEHVRHRSALGENRRRRESVDTGSDRIEMNL